MNAGRMTYAAITPARDEAENLRRLADSMVAQTVRPTAWLVVDNGSTDGTRELVSDLASRFDWIRLLSVPGVDRAAPGAPVVRAFHAGLAEFGGLPDVIVKLDADVSFDPDYFERLLGAFADEPTLGIASGSCWESKDGEWHETRVTGDHVRGASRAYRRECLQDVLPLVEGHGWDGIDELKANVRGWRTRIVAEVPFYHHRRLGERDGARHSRWLVQGHGAYFMGYRPSYLFLRALHHSRRDPAALAMLWGYVESAARRRPRWDDREARDYMRQGQRLRVVAQRSRPAVDGPA
jgi:glycosyltransferase involved in cell wall biosynthesis